MEEKVYRKFEIKLQLTVNDVLFGYKGHSQHFSMIWFINDLILVTETCVGIFKYSTPLETKFLFDREFNVRSITEKSLWTVDNDVRTELYSVLYAC